MEGFLCSKEKSLKFGKVWNSVKSERDVISRFDFYRSLYILFTLQFYLI